MSMNRMLIQRVLKFPFFLCHVVLSFIVLLIVTITCFTIRSSVFLHLILFLSQ